MSNIWIADTPVENNRVLDLSRGNQATWKYKLSGNREFPSGTSAYLKLFNTYGQTLDTWDGTVDAGTILFDESAPDGIPRGSSWQLFAEIDGTTRLLAQGLVIRTEAPFPDAAPASAEYDGARYQYAFGTPGYLVDPAWRIMFGQPRVYDNSLRSLPNGCSAGSILGGDLTLFGKASMLWYAPLRTDAVRLTYNTVRNFDNSNGSLMAVVCSNYNMTNWVGFRHSQVFGVGQWDNDTLQIVVGSSPTDYVVKASIQGDTANNTYYTGAYNPLDNVYRLYKNGNQILTWTDQTNIVNHGVGERYVGFSFQGAALNSGVQVSDWLIADAP